MFQKGVESYYTANISREIFPAHSCWEVRIRAFSIEFDNIISIVEIRGRIFVREFPAKELGKTLHLNFMNGLNIEPRAATGDDECSFCILFLHQYLLLLVLIRFCVSFFHHLRLTIYSHHKFISSISCYRTLVHKTLFLFFLLNLLAFGRFAGGPYNLPLPSIFIWLHHHAVTSPLLSNHLLSIFPRCSPSPARFHSCTRTSFDRGSNWSWFESVKWSLWIKF